MQIAKAGVDSKTFQSANPYQYPQRLLKIDNVSWVVGGIFGIVLGLLVPLVVIDVLFNVVTWVIHTYPSVKG